MAWNPQLPSLLGFVCEDGSLHIADADSQVYQIHPGIAFTVRAQHSAAYHAMASLVQCCGVLAQYNPVTLSHGIISPAKLAMASGPQRDGLLLHFTTRAVPVSLLH